MSESTPNISSQSLASRDSALAAARNEFRAVGRIEQLAQLNLINDQQSGLAESRRSLVEHNKQTERAYRKMVDRQCGDGKGNMPEDETITNNLGDTTIHQYPQAAKRIGVGGLVATAITGAIAGSGVTGVIALMLANLLSSPAKTEKPATVTAENQAAKIELFYDDPVKGLIPLSGATDDKGAAVKE